MVIRKYVYCTALLSFIILHAFTVIPLQCYGLDNKNWKIEMEQLFIFIVCTAQPSICFKNAIDAAHAEIL
jgi:hypothetical protein